MKYTEGCKKAFEYFKKLGKTGIGEANDLGECWLFSGGDPDAIEDGGHAITVNKETGELAPFILPDMENFKLLEKAVPVDIPKEYKYKAS